MEDARAIGDGRREGQGLRGRGGELEDEEEGEVASRAGQPECSGRGGEAVGGEGEVARDAVELVQERRSSVDAGGVGLTLMGKNGHFWSDSALIGVIACGR